MRRLLIIFLVFLLFNLSIATKSKKAIRKQIAKSLKKIKEIQQSRKLQSSDESKEPEEIPDVLPNENKRSNYQLINFNNYKATRQETKVTFNVFFYFFGVVIPVRIRMPMIIRYRRLRDLQEGDTSVDSICDIIKDSKVENANGGETYNYNCSAPKEEGAEIEQLSVAKEEPMVMTDESGKDVSVPSEDLNYASAASAESATNIQNNEEVIDKVIILQNGRLESETKAVPEYFLIKGDLTGIEKGKTIVMTFNNTITNSSGENVDLDCLVEDVQGNEVTINCDTSGKNLTFKVDGATGKIDSTVLTLNMTSNDQTVEKITSNGTDYGSNHINYRKNSSGLSGGAIAGIVIACAVVLIAASIVAMMLRKPAPPLDNTTVVGLKTVDNY